MARVLVWWRYAAAWRRVGGTDITDQAAAHVGWIGDSLTAGMTPATVESALRATFADARCDGLVGRSIIDGVAPYIPSSQDVVSAWRASGYNPRTWVIALVTNDEWDTNSGWTTKINTLLDLITSVPHGEGPYRVYWVGLTYRPDVNVVEPAASRVARWVTVAHSVADARTDCTVLPLDWNALMHDGRDETGLWDLNDSTGRHMTSSGYALRRSVLVPLIVPPVTTYGRGAYGAGAYGG